jgi:hypothetical protein
LHLHKNDAEINESGVSYRMAETGNRSCPNANQAIAFHSEIAVINMRELSLSLDGFF